MNFKTSNINRKLAVLLAALFMVCTSFVVLSDESMADDDNEGLDPKEIADTFKFREVTVPTIFDITAEGDYVFSGTYTDVTILVKSGANLNADTFVTFDGCEIYFEGAFTIDFLEMNFVGDYLLVFNGLTMDAAGVFGDIKVHVGAPLACTAIDGGFAIGYPTSLHSTVTVYLDDDGEEVAICLFSDIETGFIASYTKVAEKIFTVDIQEVSSEIISLKGLHFYGDFAKHVYTMDVGGVTEVIDKAELEADIAEAHTNPQKTAEYSVQGYTLKLNNSALKNVTSTTDVIFSVEPVEVPRYENTTVFDIRFGTNTFGNEGDEITVTLPYTLKDGESAVGIYVGYINDYGEVVKMPTTYSNGAITFTTSHLSYYGIFYEPLPGNDSDSNNVYFFAAFAVAVVVLIVALVLNFADVKIGKKD